MREIFWLLFLSNFFIFNQSRSSSVFTNRSFSSSQYSNYIGIEGDENNTINLLNSKRITREVEKPNTSALSSSLITNELKFKKTSSSDSESLILRTQYYFAFIKPYVKSISSHSVRITLDIHVKFLRKMDPQLDSFGVKVIYRCSDDDSIENEMVLMVRNITESNYNQTKYVRENELLNDYLVSDLYSDTSYVFCFSVMESDFMKDNPKNEKDEYPQMQNNSDKESLNTNTSNKMHFRSEMTSSISSNGSDLASNTVITSENNSSTTVKPLRRRNFAYTNTGKLIYLPISAWTPHNHMVSHHKRKRRAENVESNHCLNIKTLSKFQTIFTPLFISVICLSFIIILITVVITLFLFRKLYFKARLKKIKENWKVGSQIASGYNNDKKPEVNSSRDFRNKSEESSNIRNSYLENRVSEELDNLKNNANLHIQPVNCHKTYVKPDRIPKSKRPGKTQHALNISLKGNNNSDFHPGYEIPPFSTVEVYGYDFPKNINKRHFNSISETPSSCELNDYFPDSVWDNISCKLNLNKCNTVNKHSDVTKCLDSLGNNLSVTIDKHNEFNHYPIVQRGDKYPKKLKIPTFESCCSSPKDLPYNISPNRTLPLKTSNSIKGNFSKDYASDNEEYYSDVKDFIDCKDMKTCKSLGDVTITGGILVEVPEGYVYPKSNPKPVPHPVLKISVV